MKRKVNRVGQNTLTVSLPRKWTERLKLKAGEEVEVSEEKDKVIISKQALSKDIQRISFNIENIEKLGIAKSIRASYKKGCNEVEFYFKDPIVLDEINKQVNDLIGFEIISQRSDYCLVKNVASPHKESFPDLIKKDFQVVISMAEEILQAFQNKDNQILSNIELMEATQNKLTWACQRLILEYESEVINEPFFVYYIISELESVADDLKYICEYYKDKKITVSKDGEEFFKEFIHWLKSIDEQLFKFDINNPCSKRRAINHQKGLDLLINGQEKEKVMVSYLLSAYLKVHHIRREIFPIVMKQIDYLNKK